MNVAELCALATHRGFRYYLAGRFGCDACKAVTKAVA
jgi:hypothetical protein